MNLRSKALWAVAALLAVNAVLLAAQPGLALPRSLASYFFGPKLVRMDVVVKERGGLEVWRVDRGRVRAVRPLRSELAVLEADGTVVVVPVAPDATVLLNGRPVGLAALRRGATVTTARKGDAPAERVEAVGGGGGKGR